MTAHSKRHRTTSVASSDLSENQAVNDENSIELVSYGEQRGQRRDRGKHGRNSNVSHRASGRVVIDVTESLSATHDNAAGSESAGTTDTDSDADGHGDYDSDKDAESNKKTPNVRKADSKTVNDVKKKRRKSVKQGTAEEQEIERVAQVFLKALEVSSNVLGSLMRSPSLLGVTC